MRYVFLGQTCWLSARLQPCRRYVDISILQFNLPVINQSQSCSVLSRLGSDIIFRVFGEVPDSVKESLAAKEALREATANSFEQGPRRMEESALDAGGTTKVNDKHADL